MNRTLVMLVTLTASILIGSATASQAAEIPASSITFSGAGGDGPPSNVHDGNNATWTYGGHALTFQLDGIYNLTGYSYRDRPTGNSDPLVQNFYFVWNARAAAGWSGSIIATSNDTDPVTTQSGTFTGTAGTVVFWGDVHRGGAQITLDGTKVADRLAQPTIMVGASGSPYSGSYDWSYALDLDMNTESAAAGNSNAYLALDFTTAKKISYIQLVDRETNTGTWEFSNVSDFSSILTTVNYDNSVVDAGSAVDITGYSASYRPRLLDLTASNINARYARWTSTSGNNAGLRELTFYTVIPEPSSFAMLAFGMISLWMFRRKTR